MKYKGVVWDWNGTLLDDLDVGVNALNDMLERRGLPLLSKEGYRKKFGFPVIDFYRKIGFDMEREAFGDLSEDFVATYDRYACGVELNEEAKETLGRIRQGGMKQYVLSALREDLLCRMLVDFRIESCFDRVCGAGDIYAAGKIERGRQLLCAIGIRPEETLMIGDTVHDAEVAEALGFDCVLYAGGHNDELRLAEKAPVIHRLGEVPVICGL